MLDHEHLGQAGGQEKKHGRSLAVAGSLATLMV